MPPKRKPEAVAGAAKAKSKKVYGKAIELPEGEVLVDFSKCQWRLGRSFATGGFGRIYTASTVDNKSTTFVAKIEPSSNGPIFQEIHFYQRVAKQEKLEQYKKQKRLQFLGIPPFVAAGLHSSKGHDFRFLIMPKCGADLERRRAAAKDGRLNAEGVFRIARCVLDALEYLHENQYVHADVKAENLLEAEKSSFDTGRYYLVDYGLAKKVSDSLVYKEDPKKAHDGTLIFTSMDAHRGCSPAYRGDVEILGYNIVYWLTGSLPWLKTQDKPEMVFASKQRFSQTFPETLKTLCGEYGYVDQLTSYFRAVFELKYDEKPKFQQLHRLLQPAASKATARKTAPATESKKPASGSASVSTPSSSKLENGGSASRPSSSTKNKRFLQNFLDDSDSEASGFEPRKTPRNGVAEKGDKILASGTETSSTGTTPAATPNVIIPGKLNMQQYRTGLRSDAAKRRSSMMIVKKYLTTKTKTTVKNGIAGKTRRVYISSSSSEDDEEEDEYEEEKSIPKSSPAKKMATARRGIR